MSEFNHIKFNIEQGVARLELNRPELHNAFNIEMIREISLALAEVETRKDVRIIQIKANGRNFSAGADLNWMKAGQDQSPEEIQAESTELARMFYLVYNSPAVTMVMVQGKCLGGANGIVAAADIVIAAETTGFAFTEARLGLVPATIAPYVTNKAGIPVSREWILTARMIDAREAADRNLVNHVVPEEKLDEKTAELTSMLLANGPEALKGIKEMLKGEEIILPPGKQIESSAQRITRYRTSPEGQEGIQSFLNKRKPGWANAE